MRLLDSNIFILAARREAASFAANLFELPYAFSVVTRIEVLGFQRIAPEDRKNLHQMLEDGVEIALSDSIASTAIRLRQARRMGLGDSIIAATALEHSLPLVTRNERDFRPISNLVLLPA